MNKLIQGIKDFRRRVLPTCRERFAKLAEAQHPDALFVTCSDSRVAPNWFASTNPGDLFVIRNVGNIISPCGEDGRSLGDESEFAAVEFAIMSFDIPDIIICGHSECGAIRAIMSEDVLEGASHLRSWLKHGQNSLRKLESGFVTDHSLSTLNQLSQLNVLEQIENMKTYPLVMERLKEGRLRIHAWWFDIAEAAVYSYREDLKRFILIDEA